MTKKKKIIILAGMVMLLVATAVLNIWLLGDKNPDPEYTDTASFFSSYRIDRETARAKEILYLESILALPAGEEYASAKTSASIQMEKIAEIIEIETLLEGLLKAKGYEDAVISISTNSESIHVIVMCDETSELDTLIILNAVADVMGKSATELVKIFNV